MPLHFFTSEVWQAACSSPFRNGGSNLVLTCVVQLPSGAAFVIVAAEVPTSGLVAVLIGTVCARVGTTVGALCISAEPRWQWAVIHYCQ